MGTTVTTTIAETTATTAEMSATTAEMIGGTSEGMITETSETSGGMNVSTNVMTVVVRKEETMNRMLQDSNCLPYVIQTSSAIFLTSRNVVEVRAATMKAKKRRWRRKKKRRNSRKNLRRRRRNQLKKGSLTRSRKRRRTMYLIQRANHLIRKAKESWLHSVA